jgi:Rps23 Pro-64 3,4-dihydroxylase Tpa1-like proline 4-hydroxylase
VDCKAEVSGMIEPAFASAKVSGTPFPHVRIPTILSDEQGKSALNWLKKEAPWRLRVEHFYEQSECSLLGTKLSEKIGFLVDPSFIEQIREAIWIDFKLRVSPTLVDVNAHRLTPGQTIRIHNDFIEDKETHRLLVQLNDGWTAEQGGLLMLFRGPTPEDAHSVILPRHRSGFAFEISPLSFHAVSQIKYGERYTVVYSFRGSN